MNTFLQRLETSAHHSKTLLCLGLDPDPDRIALVLGDGGVQSAERYLNQVLDALDIAPAAFKPNLAYFEQYGSAGLAMLERLLPRLAPVPVILDAKRGDIGRSSAAYARALFLAWQGDAATVSPWMGQDSVDPFLEHCPERGVYLLLRTSNPGHQDLQKNTWRQLAQEVKEWAQPGLGAVVGATNAEDLKRATELLPGVPLLIPGVGSQGGTPEEVMEVLKSTSAPWLHRVNVSSAFLFASSGPDFARAAALAARGYAERLAWQ